jgi:hypothetical protein
MKELKTMKNVIFAQKNENGSVTIIALIILIVLTIIGISASRTATIDIKIAANQIPYKKSFYISEGGVNRESIEVGSGSYPVLNVDNFGSHLADEAGQDNGNPLPSPTPHEVAGHSYDFDLVYEGHFLPPAGYSVTNFSRYDYSIDSTAGNVEVDSRYYKIGPNAGT